MNICLRQARREANAAQILRNLGWRAFGPFGLFGVEKVCDGKKFICPAAARDDRAPKSIAIEINLAIGEMEFACVNIISFEFLKNIFVEGAAMGAGIAGIFCHLNWRVFGSKCHLKNRGGVNFTCFRSIGGTEAGSCQSRGRGRRHHISTNAQGDYKYQSDHIGLFHLKISFHVS